MRIKQIAAMLAVVGAAFAQTGCTEVKPWERGNLARDEMGLNPLPNLEGIREHIFTSRESSQGGHQGSGGGCGCN